MSEGQVKKGKKKSWVHGRGLGWGVGAKNRKRKRKENR